jgi:hypothetical protein
MAMSYQTDEERRTKIKMAQRPKPNGVEALGAKMMAEFDPSSVARQAASVNTGMGTGVSSEQGRLGPKFSPPLIQAPQVDWVGQHVATKPKPAPSTATSPRPEVAAIAGAAMGATQGPDPRLAAIKQNQLRARNDDQGLMRKMQFLDSQRDHGGLTPEQKAAALNERRGMAMQRIDIDEQQKLNRDATAPSMTVQTPEQVRMGQGNLNNQGVDIARARIKELQTAGIQPGADQAAIEGQLREEFRKLAVFTDRANQAAAYEGPDYERSMAGAEKAVAGQRRIAAGQDESRELAMGFAEEGIGRGDEERAAKIRMAKALRARDLSGVEAETAGNTVAIQDADPAVQEQIRLTKLAQARAEAARATGIANAYSGGGMTPEVAQIKGEQRAAGISLVGLGNPESMQSFKEQAIKNLDALDKGNNSVQAMRDFELQTLPRLEELAQASPESAAVMAREFISFLGDGQPTITQLGMEAIGGTFGVGPLHARARAVRAAARNSVKAKLERIAGIGQ